MDASDAIAIAAGTAVTAEVAHGLLGVPKDVLYAALAGACVGLARNNKSDDWKKFIAPTEAGWQYIMVMLRSLWLAFTVFGNALVCGWMSQIVRHIPREAVLIGWIAPIAEIAQLPVAGVLAWASWTLLPSAVESLQAFLKRKAEGQ